MVFRKLIPEFEKETGIRVNNVGGYSKDDEWWAKVQTGESFDIIVPGGNRVPNGIAAGAFNKIDLSKVPNYANLFERVQKVPDFMKDGDHYVVPMSQVIYAMFYNTNHFATAPESWYRRLGRGAVRQGHHERPPPARPSRSPASCSATTPTSRRCGTRPSSS